MFRPNIERKGRILRAVSGMLFLAGGIAWGFAGAETSPWSRWVAGIVALAGLFQLFEAARGWCVLRACGWKTPL